MISLLLLLVAQPVVIEEAPCATHCVSVREATLDLDEANTELEKCQARWGVCKRQKDRIEPVALLPAPCPEVDYTPVILPLVGAAVVVSVVTFVLGFVVGGHQVPAT